MYRFYCDDTLFYQSGIDDSDYQILNAKLTVECGKIGSLTFTIPHTNIIYDYIQKLKSIITVYDGSEEIFRGRVLYDEKDLYKRKTINCEGELAFLLDSLQRPYEHKGSLKDFIVKLIEAHNSQVEKEKQFTLGNITVVDNNDYLSRSSIDYNNTYNVINEKLIGSYGGYLKPRSKDGVRYIDYLETYGEVSDQIIEFGVNLLDIKEFITAENIFTCLIPLGAKDETTGMKLTIADANNGIDYLTSPTAIDLFGKIWATNTWEDVTVASNLKKKGQAYLDANIEMSVTLTLKAVDLHLLNIDTKRIREGDELRVISTPHNIDRYFRCSRIDIDPLSPENSEYTFGASYKTLTDPSTGIDDKVISYVDDAITKVEETTKKEIAQVKDSLTQEEIMDIITNNGQVEGVYLIDGQIWIKGTYIETDSITAEKLKIEGLITVDGNIKIHEDGSLEAKNAKFSGEIESSSYATVKTQTMKYEEADIDIMADLFLSEATPTNAQLARYDLNQNGHIDSNDALFIQRLLQGQYGQTNGTATITDYIFMNVDNSGALVLERRLNGTTITKTEYNSGSINKIGGSITIDGEPVVTSISGTVARFG